MKITIVSHTHWDREWNQTFQGFRKRLVVMMDELLDVLETEPEYRYFHFDGQTVVLDDYLQIRPENRERLRKALAEGRLIVGPWYVMPDEGVPSGESLVRNLLRGRSDAHDFGVEPMKVGYVTDIFGHTGQMPQIFRGFGHDSAVVTRGLGGFMKSEFDWASPDGSTVLALKRDEDRTYSDLYFALRWPFHGRAYDEAELVERFGKHLAYIRERSNFDSLLMLDGVDQMDVNRALPWMIGVLRKAFPEHAIEHGRLADYVAELGAARQGVKLDRLEGELREPGRNGMNNLVLANVLSSRVHLKQSNARCEDLLTREAEPFAVFADLRGRPYPAGFLRHAWEYLLQNHPHDSIGGCSMTEVHEDMMYRFHQCERIVEDVHADTMAFLADRVDASALPGDQAFVLFDPSQTACEGTCVVRVEMPPAGPVPADLRIWDAEGREVPFQILDHARVGRTIFSKDHIPTGRSFDVYTIAMRASVPAFGWAAHSFLVAPPESTKEGAYSLIDERRPHRTAGSQRVGLASADNGALRLEVASNGSVSITDHASGRTYPGLLVFEDEADVGDGWVHRAPLENRTCLSLGRPADVSVIHDGPLSTALRVGFDFPLPEGSAGNRRSEKTVDVRVETTLTLLAGRREVDCVTTVDNAARNHRMRLLFPTLSGADRYWTNNAFDLTGRPVKRKDYSEYRETDAAVVPNHGLVAVHDGKSGIAVFNKALYEAIVRDDADRTLVLTLFRSTASEVANGSGDGGQLLRKLTFEYAIAPFEPGELETGLLDRFDAYRAGSTCRRIDKSAGSGDALPPRGAFLKLDAARVRFSSLKLAEDRGAYILRLFNPSDREESVQVGFDRPVGKVFRVRMDEGSPEPLASDGSGFTYGSKPREIATFRIEKS